MNYSAGDISLIINGKILQQNNTLNICHLLTDSRSLVSADNSLFIALVSKRNDGHRYIDELYSKGVKNFIISSAPSGISSYPEATFILAENTLEALQKLSAEHRKKFSIPVIGITGSNGKTIVKEWLYQLMSDHRKIVRSPKSYNSQIGVPLSVWQMEADDELGIFEAGISEPDEMSRLQAIIQPTIGIFTNIGHAHDENFINKTQKIGEKLKLFTKVQKLIYCADYFDIKERILKSGIFPKENLFSWGRKDEVSLFIKEIFKNTRSTKITAVYQKNETEITINFTDDASIENAIHCWAAMLLLGFENETISNRMLMLTPVAMRLELKEGTGNCSLIDDYYNLDINSLKIALDFLNTQKQHLKKTVILSDILQSGRNEIELYTEIARLLKDKNISRLIGIGKAICSQAENFPMEKLFFNTTEDFINALNSPHLHSPNSEPIIFRNETILLKGARSFRFEQISNILQQKTHETTLEINLSALIHNLNFYRSLLKHGTKIIAMVKAFSYGSGSFEIANALQFHHIDYLAVAYTDEGIELRKAGITVPVIVMNPEEESFDALIKYNLEPEIYNFRILNLLASALKSNILDYENAISIHIKFDTGMHRLGFELKDIPALIGYLHENRQFHVKSVFSHLAGSYDSKLDDFTHQQIRLFNEMCDKILPALPYPVMRHLLNSAGIVRFPDAQYDMVRPGIGLYGVPSVDAEKENLKNVSSLKTIISQIKTVTAKESIGYGREFIAQRDMKIAVLPIGYADGLSRTLSNGKGKVYVSSGQSAQNGSLAPVVGNISMDMCMIDITDIPAEEGDEVIIFGDEYPITNLAKQLGTIPYEVLTSISRRVKRIYFQE